MAQALGLLSRRLCRLLSSHSEIIVNLAKRRLESRRRTGWTGIGLPSCPTSENARFQPRIGGYLMTAIYHVQASSSLQRVNVLGSRLSACSRETPLGGAENPAMRS